jgi:hypothetical protein
MRTTVTIDPDVEQLLREAMEREHKPFKQALNEALRRGLKAPGTGEEAPFLVRSRPLKLRPGIDPSKLRDLDDEAEVEEFLRKTRALEARLS